MNSRIRQFYVELKEGPFRRSLLILVTFDAEVMVVVDECDAMIVKRRVL